MSDADAGALARNIEASLLAKPSRTTRIEIGPDISIDILPSTTGKTVAINVSVPDGMKVAVAEHD